MSDLRNTGDAWVTASDGKRYWGRFGAAGLLAHDPAHGILLQHRVDWSDHGGTWGIPGGARHSDESALDAAFRESHEEAGVPHSHLDPRFSHVLDRGGWDYTTVIAHVHTPFTPVISDPESHELRWVPVHEVENYPLHPAFALSWQQLRPLLTRNPVFIVDAANVVGSLPNGWWRDRIGAHTALRSQLDHLHTTGLSAAFTTIDAPIVTDIAIVYPQWIMVVEGAAREVSSSRQVRCAAAPASGDDEIVRLARDHVALGDLVTVVTSDRELQQRVVAVGAEFRNSGTLRRVIDAEPADAEH